MAEIQNSPSYILYNQIKKPRDVSWLCILGIYFLSANQAATASASSPFMILGAINPLPF